MQVIIRYLNGKIDKRDNVEWLDFYNKGDEVYLDIDREHSEDKDYDNYIAMSDVFSLTVLS